MTNTGRPAVNCVCGGLNRLSEKDNLIRIVSLVDDDVRESYGPSCPDGDTFNSWSMSDGLGQFSPAANILLKQQQIAQQTASAAAKQQAAAAVVQRLQQRKSIVRKRKIDIAEPQPFVHFDDLRNHAVRYRHENVLHMRDVSEKPAFYRPNGPGRIGDVNVNVNLSNLNSGVVYADSSKPFGDNSTQANSQVTSYLDLAKQSAYGTGGGYLNKENGVYASMNMPGEKQSTLPFAEVSKQRFQAVFSQLQRVISNQDIGYTSHDQHYGSSSHGGAMNADVAAVMQQRSGLQPQDARAASISNGKLLQSRPELAKTKAFSSIVNNGVRSNPTSSSSSNLNQVGGSGSTSVMANARDKPTDAGDNPAKAAAAAGNKQGQHVGETSKVAQIEFARQLEDKLLALLQQRGSSAQMQVGSRLNSASRDLENSSAMTVSNALKGAAASTSNAVPNAGLNQVQVRGGGVSATGSARSNNSRLQRPAQSDGSRLSIATFNRQAAVLGLNDDRDRVLLRTVQVKPVVGGRPNQSNALLRAARVNKVREKRNVTQ